MSKFVFSFRAREGRTPSDADEAEWAKWFEELGATVTGFGNRVGRSTHLGTPGVLAGYVVVDADSLEAAVDLAKGCPGLGQEGGIEVGEVVPSSDRIEKNVLVHAPQAKVWPALADARTFGRWFGVDMGAPLVLGTRVRGNFTIEGYEHIPFEITIERNEPERLFSWRRHHHPAEPGADDEPVPTTLVVFELDELEDGTLLTVVESGFNGIPPSRRAEMYRAHEDGWTQQMEAIKRYVEGAA